MILGSSRIQCSNSFNLCYLFGSFAAGDSEVSSKGLLCLSRAKRFCVCLKCVSHRPQDGAISESAD